MLKNTSCQMFSRTKFQIHLFYLICSLFALLFLLCGVAEEAFSQECPIGYAGNSEIGGYSVENVRAEAGFDWVRISWDHYIPRSSDPVKEVDEYSVYVFDENGSFDDTISVSKNKTEVLVQNLSVGFVVQYQVDAVDLCTVTDSGFEYDLELAKTYSEFNGIFGLIPNPRSITAVENHDTIDVTWTLDLIGSVSPFFDEKIYVNSYEVYLRTSEFTTVHGIARRVSTDPSTESNFVSIPKQPSTSGYYVAVVSKNLDGDFDSNVVSVPVPLHVEILPSPTNIEVIRETSEQGLLVSWEADVE